MAKKVPLVRLHVDQKQELLIEGILDFNNVDQVYTEGCSLFQGNDQMVVNLKKVKQCNSSALALLIAWYRHARDVGKEIIFKNTPKQLIAVAKISELDKYLPIC